ncbi:MAG: Holliday junction branch migration protein RuvA [Ferrovum sp.]|nr:Holliday junction branch migration protein RuvA [Ferrovum sp.]NDU87270.1 Holliday junction branch migration protein RuvA [Ferrovum sp.]
MIGRLTGIVVQKTPPQLVLEVNGVGYEVEVPLGTFTQLPPSSQSVLLFTHFVVREDAQLLYGFITEEERAAFRQLLKISGVGPRLALAVLSGLSVAELSHAVERQEVDRLVSIPGIGKKTAQRLLLELKEKLAPSSAATDVFVSHASSVAAELGHALASLGYHEREVSWVLKQLPAEGMVLEEGIRQSLRLLARKEG